MDALLHGVSGPVSGRSIRLETDQITIGRSASNTVCIRDASVSREHCIVRVCDGHYEIEDLDSYNGTFVNGLRVKTRALNDGDRIFVGEIQFIFHASDAGAARVVGAPAGGEATHSVTMFAPDLPLARETKALMRVSEIVRVFQSLYLERDESARREMEHRLFEPIFELIPSRRGALALSGGEGFRPFAAFAVEGAAAVRNIPERVLDETSNQRVVLTGKTGDSDWIAAPLILAQRVTGVLHLDSGGTRRDYLKGDAQMIAALCDVLALALENARDLESLRFENDELRSGAAVMTPMVGNSAAMKALFDAIAKVSRSNATVLIRGESGTGKEMVARAIHRNGPRAARPFVVVNCAAIPEALLESEFFGHEKGAFTGATAQRKGRFEMADTGTIFLDEIGELAMPLQSKLLRVLQEHEFERVGGSKTLRVDVRLVAATNRDLEAAMKKGTFREDLFYRLNVVPLRVPPLRDRREDISLLANWFVRKFAEQSGRTVTGISREARALLAAYEWPGNVRELQNVMERAVVMGSSDVVTPDDLFDLLPDTAAAEVGEAEAEGFHEAVRQTRRRLVAMALERADGSVPAAAKALRLHPNYLHRLITTLGLRAGEEM